MELFVVEDCSEHRGEIIRSDPIGAKVVKTGKMNGMDGGGR